jgi:hypothetical protein
MATQHYKCLLGGVISGILVAGQTVADGFAGSVSAETGQSDNAFKQAENTVAEQQQKYDLTLGGSLTNSWLAATVQYSARAETYAEESQENRKYIEGKSTLLLGKQNQPAELLLSHSRTTLLRAPDAINVANNMEAREIVSAFPKLNARITAVDTGFVKGEYTGIHFLENENNNAIRKGATLGFEHQFSRLDNVQLLGQQVDTEFVNYPLANYTYQSAQIAYSAKLRKISYQAQAGMNQTQPDNGDKYASPAYLVNLEYKSGGIIMSASTSQTLTDTAIGSNNNLPNDDLPSSDGSGVNPGQIERKSVELRLSSSALFERTTVSLGAFGSEDSPLGADQKSTALSWFTGVNYAFTPDASLAIHYSNGAHKFDTVNATKNYNLHITQVEFSYQFNRSLSAHLFAQEERRHDKSDTTAYDEKILGAGLKCGF